MLWCNSVRLWKGDNTTKIFPFEFRINKEGRGVFLGIEYKLSKKLTSGGCVDISNGLYTVNINESTENGVLKTLRLMNHAYIPTSIQTFSDHSPHGKSRTIGAIIDIDVSKIVHFDDHYFKTQFEPTLEQLHNIEKELFFGMLRNEFIQSRVPIYGDR
jgi:uncharacterized protein (TIGR04255 family)